MDRSPKDDQQLRATAKQWAHDIRRCRTEEVAASMVYLLRDQLITCLAETTHKIREESQTKTQQADLWEGKD